MRKQLNVRVPELTHSQIEELMELLPAESQSHVIMVAVERLYNQSKPAPAVSGERKMK